MFLSKIDKKLFHYFFIQNYLGYKYIRFKTQLIINKKPVFPFNTQYDDIEVFFFKNKNKGI